ncbi:MAG: methionine aminotransferase [Hyphomicrobiales bacterium]
MPEYKQPLDSKMGNEETSIFAVMTNLSNKYDALNFSQGFPNFDISSELIQLVHKYMQYGYNQYAPMGGTPELRKAISEKYKLLYNIEYNPDTEINITAGATQGLYTIITSMIKKDDEVIIFEPAYDSYAPSIRFSGGKVIGCQLKAPDFRIDFDDLKSKITSKTKMIIINSPHNPTGIIISEAEMKALENIIEGTKILLLSDEVYEHLVYDGKKHESACKYPGLINNTFITGSFGKTFHATGWKMGYVLAPANLMEEFRKLHQYVVFTCNTPIQLAIAEHMKDPENYLHLNDFYQRKRDAFIESIKGSRFKPLKCEGTYFQVLDYSDISNEYEMEFAHKLIAEHKIASIPIAPFYKDKVNQNILRFCFAKTEESIQQAGEILKRI